MDSKDNNDVCTYSVCQLKNISCFGCCGRKFKSKASVTKQINSNTYEFRKIRVVSSLNLLRFRDRFSDDNWAVSDSGVCTNLVKFDNGVFACPLHKNINDLVDKKEFLFISQKDLRWGHCDVNFECETVKIYKRLDDKIKKEYIEWLLKLTDIDDYSYSVLNVDGVLIKRFLREIKHKVI